MDRVCVCAGCSDGFSNCSKLHLQDSHITHLKQLARGYKTDCGAVSACVPVVG